MSYEFTLYRRKAHEGPRVTARAYQKGRPPCAPPPGAEALIRRAADLLVARNPHLRLFSCERHNAVFAQLLTMSAGKVPSWYPLLRAHDPSEEGSGIEIAFMLEHVVIRIPFWHARSRAAAIFEQVRSYLQCISEETGLFVYDPQLDRVLDVTVSLEESLACYAAAVGQMPKPPAAAKSKQKKPSWLWGPNRKGKPT